MHACIHTCPHTTYTHTHKPDTQAHQGTLREELARIDPDHDNRDIHRLAAAAARLDEALVGVHDDHLVVRMNA